jgi:hypothetical protein
MTKPLEYDEAVGDEICERLLEGASLRTIAKDENMPAASTIFKWLANNESFAEQYARAKEAQADTLADEIVDISDGEKTDADPQRDRLRVDARKWVAAKLKPKKYGDKLDVTSGNEPLRATDETSLAVRAAALVSQALERHAEPD